MITATDPPSGATPFGNPALGMPAPPAPEAQNAAHDALTWGLDDATLSQFHGHRVCVPIFEGPLDLLLYLVQRQQIDIHNLRISLITSQYLEYIVLLEALDIQVAADFVVMAARLLEIKTRSLLPSPPQVEDEEEGPDPQAVLAAQLLEYQRFREAAASLGEIAQQNAGIFARGDGNGQWDGIVLDQISSEDLFAAFRQILARAQQPAVTQIARPRFTLRQKITEILHTIAACPEGGMEFGQLFAETVTRVEIIVTFLAILELVRLRRIGVTQRGLFGEIWICRR